MKLKRFISAVLSVLLILSITVCFAEKTKFFYDGAFHEYEGNIFKLKVNDALLDPPMPPIVFNDYSVVPARAVFQDGLGATVSWDADTRKVTVKLDENKIILTIDKTRAVFNGEAVTMPIAPKIINDYTMIPARFVAEKLGMTVDFDNTTDTISINEPKQETIKITKVTYKQSTSRKAILTITTSKDDPDYNAFFLKDPTRFVFDVTDGVFAPMQATKTFDEGTITQIRFGQQEAAARIVVDMEKELSYKVNVDDNVVKVTFTGNMNRDPDEDEEEEPDEPTPPAVEPEEPETMRVFDKITYTSKSARDTVTFGYTVGNVKKSGSEITVAIMGVDLPDEEVEKKVTGYFSRSMKFTPKTSKTGTITINLKNSEVEMDTNGNKITLKSVHKDLPRSVTIDAGHGGQDAGAVGYDEDGEIIAMEKEFNLDIALMVQEMLEEEDIDVHMIREDDTYVDFLKVGSLANQEKSTLFVSIHTNSHTVDTAHGIETYGYLQGGSVSNDMTSERLSEIMLDELIDATDAYRRGVKDGKTLAVINSTQMPATLVEIGFISNPEEREKLMTEEYREKLAEAIFKGIMKAFDEMDI